MVRKFSEMYGSTEDFELPLLTTLVDKEFDIEAVCLKESNLGAYAIITLSDKSVYRTTSTVLLGQLDKIKSIIASENETVRVTLKKIKNYYVFK